MFRKKIIKSVGIVGFGAFGRLIAEHLHPDFELVVSDPAGITDARFAGNVQAGNVRAGSIAEAAACDVVVLAVPIGALEAVIGDIRPHLRPGTIVMDVVSVKVLPVDIMKAMLPDFVEVIGTHPLFGPQSAVDGVAGRKIAICPVRGCSGRRVAAFLRSTLGLKVYMTNPEEHDRQAAVVQGITHLIARVLVNMEPLPSQLTTASFERLMEAIEMVRHDSEDVFEAIERDNPYSAEMRRRFFDISNQVCAELERCD